jgi:hypothetical protein
MFVASQRYLDALRTPQTDQEGSTMTNAQGTLGPRGTLGLQVIRAGQHASIWPSQELSVRDISEYGQAHRGLPGAVNAWRRANQSNLRRGIPKILLARKLKIPHFYGSLFLSVFRADGDVEHLGLAQMRIVTTVGVKYVADDFNAGGTDVSTMKYHGLGTGATAEAVGNTTIQTELTTQYNPDNTRATGSQASATVSTNATYTTVGTNTVDASAAVTEWGLLSASTAGTLFDRVTFSVVNLASGDSLQSTFVLTLNSGG